MTKTEDNHKPVLIGGFGEKCFGKQYRQGDRVYDSNAVAMAVLASSVGGGAGCHSYLYLVDMKEKKMKPVGNIETLNGCKQKQGYFVYLPNEYAVTILTKASGMSGAGGGRCI